LPRLCPCYPAGATFDFSFWPCAPIRWYRFRQVPHQHFYSPDGQPGSPPTPLVFFVPLLFSCNSPLQVLVLLPRRRCPRLLQNITSYLNLLPFCDRDSLFGERFTTRTPTTPLYFLRLMISPHEWCLCLIVLFFFTLSQFFKYVVGSVLPVRTAFFVHSCCPYPLLAHRDIFTFPVFPWPPAVCS